MDKKELIKQTALELFRHSGEVTIREISNKSGMNVASINYYFGNKDNLLNELEKLLIYEIHNILYRIIDNTQTISERKNVFITELYEFAKGSPGFLKFIVNLFTTDVHYQRLVAINKEFSSEIYNNFIGDMIRDCTHITDEVEINNRIAIFFTSLTVSVITAEALNHPIGQSDLMVNRFKEKESFTSYCHTLFDIILKP